MRNIKKEKEDYWSSVGAGDRYEKGITAPNGIIMVKNEIEISLALQYLKGEILDAGTGTGRFAINLAKNKSNNVTALDISKEMLDLNKKKAVNKELNIRFIQSDVIDMPFDDGKFDSIISITVLRHFPEYEIILKEYIRVLKSGGILMFEMCSKDHMDAANLIIPKFGVEYLTNDFENFEVEINKDKIISILKNNGMTVQKLFPYDFLNNNNFIKILSINDLGYKIIRKIIAYLLKNFILRSLYIKIENNLLRRLSTKYSYNFMIIATKN
jgi:ubiquinone/menaquinone biosynthesis C-methylase UbiE